jgi:hypothetical protein
MYPTIQFVAFVWSVQQGCEGKSIWYKYFLFGRAQSYKISQRHEWIFQCDNVKCKTLVMLTRYIVFYVFVLVRLKKVLYFVFFSLLLFSFFHYHYCSMVCVVFLLPGSNFFTSPTFHIILLPLFSTHFP